ncbi:MAG: DUF817 family protein [Pseudomonadota bacterium]
MVLPEPGVLKVGGVPLFSGFLYAAVGSDIARDVRTIVMQSVSYPAEPLTWALGAAIYLNFFWHRFVSDARCILMSGTDALCLYTRISFLISDHRYAMPLLVAAGLATVFLWIAENLGTLTGTWVYAGNSAFHWTGI